MTDTPEVLAVKGATTVAETIRLLMEGEEEWLVPPNQKKESTKELIVEIFTSKRHLCSGTRGVDTITQLRNALAHASGYSSGYIAYLTKKNAAEPLEEGAILSRAALIDHDDDEEEEEEDDQKEEAVVAAAANESGANSSVSSSGGNEQENESANSFHGDVLEMETWWPPSLFDMHPQFYQAEIEAQASLAEEELQSAAGLAGIDERRAVEFKLAAASKRARAGDFKGAMKLQLEAVMVMQLHEAGETEAAHKLIVAIGAVIKSKQELDGQDSPVMPDTQNELYHRKQNLNAIAPKLDPEKWTFCDDDAGFGPDAEQGTGAGTDRRVGALAVFYRLCDNLCQIAEVAPPPPRFRSSVVKSLSKVLNKLNLRNAAYHLLGQLVVDNPGPDDEPGLLQM